MEWQTGGRERKWEERTVVTLWSGCKIKKLIELKKSEFDS